MTKRIVTMVQVNIRVDTGFTLMDAVSFCEWIKSNETAYQTAQRRADELYPGKLKQIEYVEVFNFSECIETGNQTFISKYSL